MERKKVITLLNEIESKFPVYEWKYGELDIWPIIKRDLFFSWFNQTPVIQTPVNQTPSGWFKKVFSTFFSLWNIFLFYFKNKTVKQAIFFGAHTHRVNWEGKFINRYFQPLITTKGGNEHVLEVEYGKKAKSHYPRQADIIFIEKYHPGFLIINKLRRSHDQLLLNHWSKFEKVISENLNVDLSGYRAKLKHRLVEIKAFIDFYNLLFKKYNPKEVFGLCYYSSEMFALHYVCNKHRIRNYDMQHGGQGSLHSMYNFNDFPKSGINILPNVFWCWDEGSTANIRKWIEHQCQHKVITGGNPWIDFQLNHSIEYKFPEQKIALYTMQEQSLDDYIVETIKATPKGLQWWIRLHPRMMQCKETIFKQLADANIETVVVIDDACSLPLPFILNRSSVHISKFSGSIIEGVILKTPTIIIDNVGIDMYCHYIENGEAVALPNPNKESLLGKILEFVK